MTRPLARLPVSLLAIAVANTAAAQRAPEAPTAPETSAIPDEAPDATAGAEAVSTERAAPTVTPAPEVPPPAPTEPNAGRQPPATDVNDEAGWGEGDDIGFAKLPPLADTEPPAGELHAGGFLRTREALWVERLDDRPLAQARQSLDLSLRYKKRLTPGADPPLLRAVGDLHLEYDLAYAIDRDEFDDATLDAYEAQIIGGESYVALGVGAFELAVGRQIVAWGQGEMLSPLDIVSPRDLREPGLAELDDIRMAVLATRAGLSFGAHRFDLLVVHESYFGLWPAPLSDFSPLRAAILEDPVVALVIGDRSLRLVHVPERWDVHAGQVFGSYTYTGRGIDLALYAASALDQQGVPELPSGEELALDSIPVRLWHPRYTLVGHAGALPVGDFVLRWEAGAALDRALATTDEQLATFNVQSERRDTLLGMAGVTWSGVQDATLGVEVAGGYVIDNPERAPGSTLALLGPVEGPSFALRWMQDLLRQRLRIIVVATAFGLGDFYGWFGRAEAQYELLDAFKVGLGYATYQPHGDQAGPMYGFDRHDRLFTTLRWDFALD